MRLPEEKASSTDDHSLRAPPPNHKHAHWTFQGPIFCFVKIKWSGENIPKMNNVILKFRTLQGYSKVFIHLKCYIFFHMNQSATNVTF